MKHQSRSVLSRKLCRLGLVHFSSLLFFAHVFLLRAEVWQLPADRLPAPGTWVNAGVTGGIINRTSPIVDVTQSPYNADSTGASDASGAIQSALNAAVSGAVVYLPAGTYRINSPLSLKSNVTLRGAGIGTTILDVRTYAGIVVPLDPSWANSYNPTSTISSGLTSGSATIVVNNPGGGQTPFTPGHLARISWPNDPNKPVISNFGYRNVRVFDCKISAVSGSALTITPPLPATFTTVGVATIVETQYVPVSHAGLEDLSIDGTSGGNMTFGMQIQMSIDSWVKNVKIIGQLNYGIAFSDSVLCTVTHCWVTGGGGGSNHSGILLDTNTALLVYDNIIENNQPGFEVNQSTTSSVIAYNLVLCSLLGIDTNHGPHNSFNLYEGNITNNFISDGYFGSESELTIFRNWITSINFGTGQPEFSIGLERFTRNASIVGNIIQSTGHTWTYDGVSLGNPNMGNSYSYGTAQPSQGSWWRDMGSDGTSPYIGTLTTRTDDNHGQITLSSGTAANLIGSNRADNVFVLRTSPTKNATFLMSVSGNVLTVDSTNGGTSQLDSLPPLNSVLNIWAGSGGFQEADLDVVTTTVRLGNYYYRSGNIPSGESLGTQTLPNSLYLQFQPPWFGTLTWPPFDPTAPGTPAYDRIPAGYRYLHGSDPPSHDGPSSPTDLRVL